MKSKKLWIYVSIFAGVCIIIITSFRIVFGTGLVNFSKDYYERHIARRPHISGQITCVIDNEVFLFKRDQVELTYRAGQGDQSQNINVEEGKFYRRDGEYGENILSLFIYPEFCVKEIDNTLKEGITIEFGYFTGNNWHKNHIDLAICVSRSTDDPNTLLIDIKQNVSGDDNGIKLEEYKLEKPPQRTNKLTIFDEFI